MIGQFFTIYDYCGTNLTMILH